LIVVLLPILTRPERVRINGYPDAIRQDVLDLPPQLEALD
jgi:hypothetical protein